MKPRELEVAEKAARVGAQIAVRHFRTGPAVFMKDSGPNKAASYNLVTEADLEAEHAIVAAIRETFPNHAVLGEEVHGGANVSQDVLKSEHLWIIDPIDGTSNFFHGIPHFGVSVAYYHNGEPACGVMGNPFRDEWFTAAKGQGAFYNSERIQVSPNPKIEEALIGFGYYYDRGTMMEATLAAVGDLLRLNIHGVRRMGAATLDLAYVGLGYFGAFFEYELAPWDFGAGRLFVEEAGGKVTDGRGGPLGLTKSSVIASNGLIHDDVLAIVGKHHPSSI